MRTTHSLMRRTVLYAQILLVFSAFVSMVLLSGNFVSDIEQRHLKKDAQDALLNAQEKIGADLLEPEVTLNIISHNVRNMILSGNGADEVREYMKSVSSDILTDKKRKLSSNGFYGFFDVFGGIYIDGDEWVPPDDYVPQQRPWFGTAVKAGGRIAVTPTYVDAQTGNVVVTYVRRLFFDNGEAMAIACLDASLDNIGKYVVNTRISEGGYGALFNERMEIIAHPNSSLIGKTPDYLSSVFGSSQDLQSENKFSERRIRNHTGEKSIAFLREIENGWHIAIVIPESKYYKDTTNSWIFLSALGALLSVLLIAILLGISSAKDKADERAQIMFDAMPLCANFRDKNLGIIDCNMGAVSLFGLSSKQEYLERFNDLSPKYQPGGQRSVEKMKQLIEKAFEEGYCCFEWMHQKLDGEPIPCEVTLVRVKHGGDFVLATYVRDLRELKAAAAKMREADERTQIMLDSTPLCANFWDKNLKNIDCNQEAVKLFELSSKQEYLERFLQLSPRYQTDGRLSSERSIENVKKAFSDGYYRFEWMHQKLDGEPLRWESMLNTVKHKENFIVEGYTRYLRELKAAMAKMREADERTEIMLNAMPLSCSLIDKNMNLIDCNQESLNLFAVSSKQEFFDRFFEFSPPTQPCGSPSKEKAFDYIRKAFREGYCRFEWIHQKSGGEQIPSEITLVRVKHGEEDVVAGYIRDLREMKAMLREMRKAEIAEENSKAKSKFLAAMSHEIRTPMNTILGITEVQLQDETLAPDVKESLTEIYNSSDLLLGIINDILDLSKIEAGKMELAPSKYEVASLINDTAQLSVMRISSKPIEFELIVDENTPMVLCGDEMRIKQILNNLLSNAFKYTEEGVVKLQIYSEKNEENKDFSTLVFRVSDTGQGMTAKQVNEIFDEYSRFNLDANRTIEGTGLGMNITQNLIHMMNGEISVDSTPGVGTTFVVRLPQKVVGSDVIGKNIAQNLRQFRLNDAFGARKTQIVRELMPYGSVLVVDDVESNLYVARRLLSPYDLSIETVAAGAEAVKKIKNGRVYDIIFMDHMMPKMDGIETVKIIRGLGYRGTIIALTANAVAGQSEMFLDSGFDAFISKPIDLRQLNAALNKFIRDKQPPEVIENARQQKVGIIQSAQISPKSDVEMLSIFMRDAQKALSAFEAALKDIDAAAGDNFQSFSSPAHAMKSVFANIGGTALSQMARELEKSAKENDKSGVEEQTRDIIALLKIVISAIQKESEKKTGGKDEDSSLLSEQLKIIADACANYDEKAAAAAMSVLDAMVWTKKTRDFLNKISEYLLHSDFEEISQLLLAQKVISQKRKKQ